MTEDERLRNERREIAKYLIQAFNDGVGMFGDSTSMKKIIRQLERGESVNGIISLSPPEKG